MVGEARPERVIGRYALYDQIGAGGMATVHYGRLLGPAGFSKTVAIKRLHPHFARDPEFASMFLDEARLAARIHHPNVVATLDVVAKDGELFLVMEFVEGLSLSGVFWECLRTNTPIPLGVIGAVIQNVLAGLHAAHEATTEQGMPLALIHRDVSPQNVLVGRDGVARVLDFGIAKAIGRSHTTREGRIKGKLAYMPPEQIRGQELDRRADIYAASVMLWELLTMRRPYDEDDDAATIYKVVHETPPEVRSFAPDVPAEIDALVMQGVSKERAGRFPTARAMAMALAQLSLEGAPAAVVKLQSVHPVAAPTALRGTMRQ
jgi:serine/threonine-protein kinase